MVNVEEMIAEARRTGELSKKELDELYRLLLMSFDWKNRFRFYVPKLPSLAEQLERLRRYNAIYWGGRFAAELDALSPDGFTAGPQSLTNLGILHVATGDPEQDIRLWALVYAGELDRGYEGEVWSKLTGISSNEAGRRYAPGIHVVRLDLVAYQLPAQEARTAIINVAEAAREAKQTLAGTEVFSAFGLLLGNPLPLGRLGLPRSLYAGALTCPDAIMPFTPTVGWTTDGGSYGYEINAWVNNCADNGAAWPIVLS